MLIAGLVTILFHRLKQPVVLGYILAGVIIGPHTPPFALIQDEHTIRTLSELGVVFLLFSLGLEFSLRKLARVGFTALVGAVTEIAVMLGIGWGLGRWFGWSNMDSIFLGAILSISSTTIIVKALSELKLKNERFAQLVFGILIVEDILAIALIALLSALATTGQVDTPEVFATLGKLSLFMVVALVLGILIVPRLLAYVARFDSSEMLLITVLGLCFGFCLLVVKLDYSIALGAFVIGAVMAESRQLKLIEQLTEPLRDMFSAIFFVSIGLLLDPAVLHALCGADRRDHGLRGAGQSHRLRRRQLHRRQRWTHFDEGGHGHGPDRRVFFHHRLARPDVESHQRLPLPDRGSGFGHHHPAHAVPDTPVRPAHGTGRRSGSRTPAALDRALPCLAGPPAEPGAGRRVAQHRAEDPAAGADQLRAGGRGLHCRSLPGGRGQRPDHGVRDRPAAARRFGLELRLVDFAAFPDRGISQAQGAGDAHGRAAQPLRAPQARGCPSSPSSSPRPFRSPRSSVSWRWLPPSAPASCRPGNGCWSSWPLPARCRRCCGNGSCACIRSCRSPCWTP